jgi:uncharacterized membrane protein YbaN (DUF454 family)
VHLPTPLFRPLPLFYKILAILLIAGFVILGLIGLVLPVIPGVVFLFLAAYLVTRVSRRAAAAAHDNAWFSRHLRDFKEAGKLTIGQRAKLSLLVMAKMVVQGVESGISFVKALARNRRG